MLKTTAIISTIVSLGLLLGAKTLTLPLHTHSPQNHPETQTKSQFQFIPQPLEKKVTLTLIGIGLIGLEIWWFLLSKPKSQKH